MAKSLNLTEDEWRQRKTAQRHASEIRYKRERSLVTGEAFIDLEWDRTARETLDRISEKYRKVSK